MGGISCVQREVQGARAAQGSSARERQQALESWAAWRSQPLLQLSTRLQWHTADRMRAGKPMSTGNLQEAHV